MFNLGIIGFGSMASYHMEQLKDYKAITIYGIYDTDPKRCQLGHTYNFKVYPSSQALLEDPAIDGVLIATTNEVHKELSIQALRAGKHVLCEKPVTLNSEELLEIMAVEKESGCVFTINQNRRTNKDFLLMKETVEKSLLGDVYVIESRVEGSRGMPKGWRTLASLGGGMMLDWGVHLIDQLLFMLPGKVTHVYCKLYFIDYPEVDDSFHLTLTFKNNLTAHIEVGTNNFITHPRWYVLGTDGSLQIDDWSCQGQVVRCLDKSIQWEHDIIYTKAGPTKTMAPRKKEATETLTLSEPTHITDHITLVYDQWLNAVEKKAPLTITSSQALRVMKVMEAAFASHRTQTSIQVSI